MAQRGAGAALATAIALVAAVAAAACGHGPAPDGVALETVCVPVGFGSVSFDAACPQGAGGVDRVCDFVFTSSNPAVVTISPATVSLGEGEAVHVILTTIGDGGGTSSLDGDSDDGTAFHITTIRVGC